MEENTNLQVDTFTTSDIPVAPVRPPRQYFFTKGNKYGHGQPKKSRNQIEPIRRRILSVVRRRIFHEKNLDSVSTTDLLKFLAQIMPKDGPAHAAQINYISNIPREDAIKAVSAITLPQEQITEQPCEDTTTNEQPATPDNPGV